MTTTIKKYSLVIMVIALAMFIFTATASAGTSRLQGTYAYSASGTVLIALCGFAPGYEIPYSSSNDMVWHWEFVANGKGTYNGNGTGHGVSTIRVTNQPTGAFPVNFVAVMEKKSDITYTLDKDGTLVVTEIPGTVYSRWISGLFCASLPPYVCPSEWAPDVAGTTRGTVSPDHKTITSYGDGAIVNQNPAIGAGRVCVDDSQGGTVPMPEPWPDPQGITNSAGVSVWQSN